MISVESCRGRVISHDPIAQICASHKWPLRGCTGSRARGRGAGECKAGPSVGRSDPLVAIVRLEMRFGRVTLFALVTHRSGNRRNPDLAVAIVEVGVLPCGVLLLLRCFRVHRPRLRSFLSVPMPPM